MNEGPHAGLRAKLVAQSEELRAASAQTEDDRKPVALDQTSVGRLSRMDSMQVQAMAVAQEKRRHDAIKRIESTIARIDADEYGDCIKCGEEIGEGRLQVDPTAPTCIRCAR
ncbi:MAG: TraR/DksA family transcriptional regulator [Hyphomonadaceae bacterium]